MASYRSFAVIGGGTVGISILNALVEKNAAVVLLSRLDSAPKTGVPSGVQVEKVDLTKPAAVAEVLKKHQVDVVLATIALAAVPAQKPLIDAAKLAGVKLFVPSEYGMATDGADPPAPEAEKGKIADYAKDVGVPTTRIFTGPFIQVVPILVGYPDEVHIIGKGETPVSCTAVEDISGYVAHVLTAQPPSALEHRILRLEGDRTRLKDLAPLFKTTVKYVDEIPASKPGAGFATILQKLFEQGYGSTGFDSTHKVERTGSDAAGSGNTLWPGHHWRSIKEVHRL